jgi:glycosyltransferase involved in cell wall biosynthesis
MPYQRTRSPGAKRVFDVLVGRRLVNDAEGVLFATPFEADGASDIVHPDRRFILPLAAQLTSLPEDYVSSWWRPDLDNRPLVIFLGRIAEVKRLDLLIESWPLVLQSSPEAALLIAGTGDDELLKELIDGVRRLGITKSVVVLGQVDGKDKTDLLNRASVLVLPSDSENFGISVAESLKAGTPVVVSANVALQGLITEYGAGRVFHEYTREALATEIAAVLCDPVVRHDMQAAAARVGQRELSWENTAAAAEGIYRLVVHRHSRRGAVGPT